MRFRRLSLVALVLIALVAAAYGGARGFSALGFCAAEFLPIDDGITTAPYVQQVSQTEATLSWWTRDPSSATLRIGPADSPPAAWTTTIRSEHIEHHRVTVDGLLPGTRYSYSVDGDDVIVDGTLTTDPGPSATVTLGVLGDSGVGNAAQRDVATLLEGIQPGLVLHTGDVVYPRGAKCDYVPSYFDPYRNLLADRPIRATFGNHDAVAQDGAMFDQVFGIPNNGPGAGDRSYLFDYGPIHIVMLDTEVLQSADQAAIARQRSWLETALPAPGRSWTIVVTHWPAFSSQTNTKKWSQPLRDLIPLFAVSGVDLVLSGHAHNYERFDPVEGVTFVVTGGGGAQLHELSGGSTEAAHAMEYHALRLRVSPEELTLDAIDQAGASFDSVTVTRNN